MNSAVKTSAEVDADWDAKNAELTGLEAKLLEMHDREFQIRTELAHLDLQRERIKGSVL